MFIKLRNYLDTIELYNRRLQDPSYGFANHVYDCHMTPVTRGALRYVSYQKGILQGHPGHRYAIRAALDLFSRIVFWAVLSIDISRHTVSYITCIFWWVISNDLNWSMSPTGCYAKQMKAIQFSNLHRLYILGHRWILVLLLILVNWYKHSNSIVSVPGAFWIDSSV